MSGLECTCKEYIKHLQIGVLIDNHLSWKYHLDYIAVKISKTVRVTSRLRHFTPFCTLRSIYQSLILPYLTYGLTTWGQATKAHLNKIIIVSSNTCPTFDVVSKSKNSCYSFFISSKILLIHLLYFEAVLHSMYDVSNTSTPKVISEKFVKATLVHSYNTRASSCGKYQIKFSHLKSTAELFFLLWHESMELSPIAELCSLPKLAFKKSLRKKFISSFRKRGGLY